MNWMLVFFMGVSPHYQIVKTDLIFSSEAQCHAKEEARAKGAADFATRILSEKKPSESKADIDRRIDFVFLQHPRGTCIPTTSKVTVN